jgi:hypothetical protein
LHQRFVVYTFCKAPPYRYHWGQSRLQLQHIPSLTHWIQLMHQCESILVHCQKKASKQLPGIVSYSRERSIKPTIILNFSLWMKELKELHPGWNLLPLQGKLCTHHTQNAEIWRNCGTNFAIIHLHQAFLPQSKDRGRFVLQGSHCIATILQLEMLVESFCKLARDSVPQKLRSSSSDTSLSFWER